LEGTPRCGKRLRFATRDFPFATEKARFDARTRLESIAMKPKTLYLALCLAGVAVPYWQFVPWVLQHGLNFALFTRELFSNRIGAFFGMDVVVSAVALLAFSRIEGVRMRIRGRWIVLVAVLTVGVSLGLPLFLYLRERELERQSHAM
jgi:hypothetical protein